MSHIDHDFDDLIGALRTELPTVQDQERIRARLAAAGVLAAGAATMAGAGSSITSGAAPGVFSSLAPQSLLATKLAALGTVPKILVVAASISAVTAPVAVQLWTEERAAPAETRPLSAEPRERSDRPVEGRLVVSRKVEERPLPKSAAAPVLPARVPNSTKALPQEAKLSASAMPAIEPRERKVAAVGSLKEETALIEQALSALRRGDVETARSLLNEHRQTFPRGALEPERNRALQRIDLEAKKNSLTEQ